MINVTSITKIENLSFEDYRALPQLSYSFVKRAVGGVAQEIKSTVKMRLGTLVDAILTGGEVDFSDELYPVAKKIAYKLRKHPTLGPALKFMKAQVSFTGVFEHRGFYLPVKGRPDFEWPEIFINDLKVCHSTDVESTIKFMGYENQLYTYAKLARVDLRILTVYCKPKDDVIIKVYKMPEDDRNYFWEGKILEYGSVKVT